jgi:hypothetical protein
MIMVMKKTTIMVVVMVLVIQWHTNDSKLDIRTGPVLSYLQISIRSQAKADVYTLNPHPNDPLD